jgi:hypothetical protein
MSLKIATSFTAGRKVVITGVTYQPGDVIPNAVVKTIVRLSALMANGMILANLDQHSRKTKAANREPNDLSPSIRKGL